MAQLRKQFGDHCMRHKDYKKANENFLASLQYEENKLDSVFRLTNSLAREANLDKALELLNEKSGLGESLAQTKSLWKPFWIKPIYNPNFPSDEFKDHFKCNLQECDCNYEKNQFEKSLLLISQKSQHYQNNLADIPHTSKKQVKCESDARMKGPKISVLENRFAMVMDRRQNWIQLKALFVSLYCILGLHKFWRHDWFKKCWKLLVQSTQIFRQNRWQSKWKSSFWSARDRQLRCC